MRFLKKFIRKLYHLIWFLTLFIIYVSPVNAEIVNYQYLGRHVGDTFGIDAGNATDSRTFVVVPSSSTRSYLVVDICSTTADMVSSSVPYDYDGSYTSFYNVYNIKNSCITGNYTGVRVRMFYSIRTWGDAGNGNFAINNTTRFYNNASYYGSYTILSVFLADSIDLGDLTINNQNIIINSITNIQGSINSSTSSINGNINQKSQDIINNQNRTSGSIIDNQNRSTGSIIDNQNRSTGSIIDNQNENTNKQIESQKVCNTKVLKYSDTITSGYIRNDSGSITVTNNWGVTDYLQIEKLEILTSFNTTGIYSCFYNENKEIISCIQVNYGTGTFNLPNGTKYARFSIRNNEVPEYKVSSCTNGNQALNDNLNDLNDNLTDSSIDSSDSTLSQLQSDLPTNSVISDLLLLPVRLLQAIVNSLGGTCSSFNLGSLYGTNLVMPCIDLQSYFGTGIWTFIDLVFSGMFILVIRKKFIQIFQNITNLRSGGNEVD